MPNNNDEPIIYPYDEEPQPDAGQKDASSSQSNEHGSDAAFQGAYRYLHSPTKGLRHGITTFTYDSTGKLIGIKEAKL